MINIKLVKIGHNSHVDFEELTKTKSKVFKISNQLIESLNPDFLEKNELTIYDNELNSMEISNNNDLLVGIIDRPLQGNYFTRRISDNFIVISTHDIEDLKLQEGISVKNFILRFIYAFSIMYSTYKGLKNEAAELMRRNVTGCLFDMAINKRQIAVFFKNSHLCISTKSVLEQKTTEKSVVRNTEVEIKRLKISKYYRYSEWMKKNPIIASLLLFLAGLVFHELLGNYIYSYLTG
jgi:hypothetical protein